MEPKPPKPTIVEQKQLSKSFEAYQQAVLIYLLVRRGLEVTVRRLDKSAKKTDQNFPIVSIGNPATQAVVHFQKEVEEQAQQLYRIEEATHPTSEQLRRHFDRNKVTIACNKLIQFAKTLHIDIEQRGTRSTKKTVKLQKINGIKDGSLVLERSDIIRLGRQIVAYMKSLFSGNEEALVDQHLIAFMEKGAVVSEHPPQEPTPQVIPNRQDLSVFRRIEPELEFVEITDFDVGIDLPNEFVLQSSSQTTPQTTDPASSGLGESIVHSYDPVLGFFPPNYINKCWKNK